jgi:UV DNA damage endonuclease
MSEYEFTDLPDYEELSMVLKDAGKLAMDNGQRLSFHPGQFCVLASPNQKVVDSAINELNKSSQIMDMMGLPRSRMAKINIHVGGAYGDKESALGRFCKNYIETSKGVRSRLTVENDDKANMYSVVDLFEGVYKVVGIPIVFDYYHHKFCTGGLTEEQALKLAASTWPEGVKQCTHYSESRAKEKMDESIRPQAHSDYITSDINDYGLDIDVVVEAKAKELAIKKYKKVLTEVSY